MTKEIYENSVLNDSTEAIEKRETEFCEDAARNVIGVVTDCLNWYAVCTATGIEGFCMKKFVAVRQ